MYVEFTDRRNEYVIRIKLFKYFPCNILFISVVTTMFSMVEKNLTEEKLSESKSIR